MHGRRQRSGVGRYLAVLGLGALALVAAAAPSTAAAGLPDPVPTPVSTPVSTATQPVTGTVTGVVGQVTRVAAPRSPAPSAGSPSATPAPARSSRAEAPRATTAPPGPKQSPASTQRRSSSAAAAEPSVAVDARVGSLVGACARISGTVVPAHASIVVLDTDLVARLLAAGVPLDKLLVPCPASLSGAPDPGSGAGAGSAASGGVEHLATTSSADTSASGGLPGRLAFTGTDVLTLAAAGALLLAFGCAVIRRAQVLRGVWARG